MPNQPLNEQQLADLREVAAKAFAGLAPTRKVEIITWNGRKYRVVRTFRGFQVQSSDARRLILEVHAA